MEEHWRFGPGLCGHAGGRKAGTYPCPPQRGLHGDRSGALLHLESDRNQRPQSAGRGVESQPPPYGDPGRVPAGQLPHRRGVYLYLCELCPQKRC